MTGRRGEGSIDARGPDTWRLRYRIDGRRYGVTVRGTKAAAQRELRRLLREGDTGEHITPSRMTVAAWAAEWLALIRRGQVTARTAERYGELFRSYVFPALGGRPLQALRVGEVDALYAALERRLSATTVRHVHVALKACLAVAVRKGLLRRNPAGDADVPRAIAPECGQALTADELRRLLAGFRGLALRPIVITAALTGARLGEVLALRWADLDPAAMTLRIERAIESTTEHGRRLKGPKSKRGERTIAIDGTLLTVLLTERERHQRLAAGIPDAIKDGAQVDLSLIKLPGRRAHVPVTADADEAAPSEIRQQRGAQDVPAARLRPVALSRSARLARNGAA